MPTFSWALIPKLGTGLNLVSAIPLGLKRLKFCHLQLRGRLEGIMLSEMSEKGKYYRISLICESKKTQQTSE